MLNDKLLVFWMFFVQNPQPRSADDPPNPLLRSAAQVQLPGGLQNMLHMMLFRHRHANFFGQSYFEAIYNISITGILINDTYELCKFHPLK